MPSSAFLPGLFLLLYTALAGWALYEGLRKSAYQLVFVDLYRFVAILTLGVAPAAWYLLESTLPAGVLLDQMPVSAARYFGYTTPLLAACWLGTSTWRQRPQSGVFSPSKLQVSLMLALGLMAAGLVFQLLAPKFPPIWHQVGYCGKMLLGIGVLHLLFTPLHRYYKALVLVLWVASLFYQFLQTTFIGETVIWLIWLGMYLQWRLQWSVASLAGLILVLLLPLLVVFSFKYSYRQNVRAATEVSVLRTFAQTLTYWLQEPFNATGWQRALMRLNQGEHLARVYRWVPEHQGYAYGQTIGTALVAAAVPRFCWPDKPGAGGQVNWKRFTGRELDKGISMNIGITGEAYGNFGPWLAPIFVFLWARLLYSGLNLWGHLASQYQASWVLWIPLVYFNLMDQENDLITQLNSLVKGSFFVFGCLGIIAWWHKPWQWLKTPYRL